MFTIISITGLKIVATGALLGLGFWASRRITDQIDIKLYMRSEAYKQFRKSIIKTEVSHERSS